MPSKFLERIHNALMPDKRCVITCLPTETLQQEIWPLLDWKSILAIGQTCRVLRFSMTYSFWSVYIKAILQRLPYIECPPEDIRALLDKDCPEETASDEYGKRDLTRLKTWALSKLRAEEGWNSGQPEYSVCRAIKITGVNYLFRKNLDVKFLPGGRWVLILMTEGEVYYCDLESEDKCAVLLIQRPDYRGTHDEFKIPLWSVWIDKSNEYLSLRIAVSGYCKRSGTSSTGRIFVVNQEGNGHEATLRVQNQGSPLAELHVDHQENKPVTAIALDTTHCIYLRTFDDDEFGWPNQLTSQWLSIYQYPVSKPAGGRVQKVRAVRTVEIDVSNEANRCQMILIPDNRLVILTEEVLHVYDYSQRAVTGTSNTGPKLFPMFRKDFVRGSPQMPLPTYGSPISRIKGSDSPMDFTQFFSNSDFSASDIIMDFTLFIDGSLSKISIYNQPNDEDQLSEVAFGSVSDTNHDRKKWESIQNSSCVVGYNRAVVLHSDNTFQVIGLNHRRDGTPQIQSQYLECPGLEDHSGGLRATNSNSKIMAMNEECGRMALIKYKSTIDCGDVFIVSLRDASRFVDVGKKRQRGCLSALTS